MPKAPPPPSGHVLKFQGRFYYEPEDAVDDWGLTPEQQETYVEMFRRKLVAKGVWREDAHDYFLLRRFMRARTYDLEKATLMFMNNIEWRREQGADTILQDFVFPERDAFIDAWPQGYHKIDKQGRPVYIQLLGKIDINVMKKLTTVDRMIKFHIYEYERCCRVILPICSKLAGRNIDTTFGIMDVKGVSLSVMTAEVRKIMSVIFKYDADNYPEMLGHICLVNAPFTFRAVWSMVKGLLDIRTQGKIEVLGPDFKKTLVQHVKEEDLSELFQGPSVGSLQDDCGPWNDPQVVQNLGFDVEELRRGNRQIPYTILQSPSLNAAASAANGAASVVRGRSLVLPKATSARGTSPPGSMADGPRTSMENGEPSVLIQPVVVDITDNLKRVRPLVERLRILEESVQEHKARAGTLQASEQVLFKPTAAEGTLLYRVEVLEGAMAALLASQVELAAQAKQKEEEEEVAHMQEEVSPPKPACCVLM